MKLLGFCLSIAYHSGRGILSSARIREIISTKFQKTAIRENLDPRNISAIRYIAHPRHPYVESSDSLTTPPIELHPQFA